jgi:hypothetical protein
MKIGWGWKIAILYGGFVIGMVTLVLASSHQKFDLVTKNYYEAELGFQKTLDAGKNQSSLSKPVSVHADASTVTIDFPEEFKNKSLSGDVWFYSPVDAEWDQNFKINTNNNSITISRKELRNTTYTIKISCAVDGKNYYQESEIALHS